MASMQQFLGFKRVSQSVFDRVRPEKKELYMWFVKPDGDLVNETGDIYLGSYHYGHYGHADADNIQELWNTLGSMFESGSSVTVTDVIEEIQGTLGDRFSSTGETVTDAINNIEEALGEGFEDESGNPITYTEAIQDSYDAIEALDSATSEAIQEIYSAITEVDNEWRRVVGDGFVDGAIEVEGERFFEGATVSNVVSANTMALMIEIDEPINVTDEQLEEMGDNAASGISGLLGGYSEVTLPEGEGNVDLNNNIVVGN